MHWFWARKCFDFSDVGHSRHKPNHHDDTNDDTNKNETSNGIVKWALRDVGAILFYKAIQCPESNARNNIEPERSE